MPTGRAEAFSDGVFAIAITLLILTVKTPGSGPLGHGLERLWPSYLAYIVSFLTIGIIWVNHHTMFRHFAYLDRTMLFLNVLFLMVVAFIPFPTQVVAEHVRTGSDRRAAALLYGITLTGLAVMFLIVWVYGSRRLLSPEADRREVSGITRSYLPGTPLYLTATLVAFASPIASLAMFAAIALFYVLSSSFFGRDE
jgi:uncharacterized membrane protein